MAFSTPLRVQTIIGNEMLINYRKEKYPMNKLGNISGMEPGNRTGELPLIFHGMYPCIVRSSVNDYTDKYKQQTVTVYSNTVLSQFTEGYKR